MEGLTELRKHQLKLLREYKQLIEQAYNLRQIDSALSDITEYKAIKKLNKLNRLMYLSYDVAKSNF